ncbi:aldehyde dehydrogenase family protein [Streptomyces sp. NBC_01754]|uniref:aldehyde dehydrogenase family protein n=1 Tax=Streptomyces sp. NBC_01754 TaxID=2975930 RepID=UPI002DDC4126|nr:aldehyde dehydrogenase family protein [Streptomyces sp. NBC_01754]WSC95852.1 aldehyde dehydrogenase family protein [Streptomyces sp. NBC_01754]
MSGAAADAAMSPGPPDDVSTDGLYEVTEAATRAARAAPVLAALGRAGRSRLLAAMADALWADRERLAATADEETALGVPVLLAEVARTADQLRLFGRVLDEGSYLGVAVDTRTADGVGFPPVRRWLVPLGPVAVFGASNFPFAYGVAGGDTASALAAGCPVVAKEHPSHPRTCALVLATLRRAATGAGAPADVVTMVSGFQAGTDLVRSPQLTAVGFTGSVGGGRALFDLCAARPSPIPFYGELGSVNPAVVLRGAARDRPADLARVLADSVLTRGGQVCTKAGLLFLPEGGDGDAVLAALSDRVDAAARPVLLNSSIRAAYVAGTAARAALPGVRTLTRHRPGAGSRPDPVPPVLLTTDATTLRDDPGSILTEECFGPCALVVRYRDTEDLTAALTTLAPSLVCALHADDSDADTARALLPLLAAGAGRVVWNDATCGLRIGWATQHGGGYPASTDSGTTSVGAAAIGRWLRPVAYQGIPAGFLPDELRTGDGGDGTGAPTVPYRLDGVPLPRSERKNP